MKLAQMEPGAAWQWLPKPGSRYEARTAGADLLAVLCVAHSEMLNVEQSGLFRAWFVALHRNNSARGQAHAGISRIGGPGAICGERGAENSRQQMAKSNGIASQYLPPEMTLTPEHVNWRKTGIRGTGKPAPT